MSGLDVVLSLVVAIVTGALGFFVGNTASRREVVTRALQLALPTLFLILVFLTVRLAFRESLSLQSFVLVDGRSDCEDAIVSLVQEANEYVYAAGSVSRSSRYFDEIEKRLQGDDNFRYKRVFWGRAYTLEFKDHLQRVSQIPGAAGSRAFLYKREEPDSFFVISDKEVIVKLPSLRIGTFDVAIRTRNPDWVKKYARYFNDALAVKPIEDWPGVFKSDLTAPVNAQ